MTNIIKLNLGRNCLRYIIRSYSIKEIYVPYYTCPIIWSAIRAEKCKIKFYHIDENFMPEMDFKENDFILYTNYFGLCGKNCKKLADKYKNLIVDNTQAFYSDPVGLTSFNSLRKFFNVPNGAYLYIGKTLVQEFETDTADLSPALFYKNYKTFVQNELIFNKDNGIKMISQGVKEEINKIDLYKEKEKGIEIYKKYAQYFDKINKIQLHLEEEDVPYCYPFNPRSVFILNKFVEKNIPLLRLWEDIPEEFAEYKILNNTVSLPLDIDEFNKILSVYLGNIR